LWACRLWPAISPTAVEWRMESPWVCECHNPTHSTYRICVCWLQVLALYESTFVGLQALGSHFPKGSAELQAAEQALVAVLSKLVTELKGVYGDDMLYQVCAALLLLVRPCVGWGFAALVRGGAVCVAAVRAGGDFMRLWCIDAGCACAWQREHACGAL
jgi:hypothetical protein